MALCLHGWNSSDFDFMKVDHAKFSQDLEALRIIRATAVQLHVFKTQQAHQQSAAPIEESESLQPINILLRDV